MMNEHGKSDRPIVPKKSPNKTKTPAAEEMEGRGLAKGNLGQQNAIRTQRRAVAPSELAQIRETAKSNKDVKFTALMHHIYRIDTLRFAYSQLKRQAAAGVDGETWQHYGEDLERNLQDLSHRLKRGAYRAKPVRIPRAVCTPRPKAGAGYGSDPYPYRDATPAGTGGSAVFERRLRHGITLTRSVWPTLHSLSILGIRLASPPAFQQTIIVLSGHRLAKP
jgi:hypothetical protein